MNLTPELFDEITQSITVVGQDEARPADRRSPRLKFNSHVHLVPWNDPTEMLSVRIQDLSIGGLGILHSQRISLDDQFAVLLPKQAHQTIPILCTVVYWEPLAENLCGIGARFERILEEEELVQRQSEPLHAPAGMIARISHVFARGRRVAS